MKLRVTLSLLYVGVLASCSFNKYSHRNSDDDQLFGPLYSDYKLDKLYESTSVFEKNVVVKEYESSDSTRYIFEYFWPNGNCLRTQVYRDSSDDIRLKGERLHQYNQSGFQGKYLIQNDTLHTEYFIGGNPGNKYLYRNYSISDSVMIFINASERNPNRKRMLHRKRYQEQFNNHLFIVKVDTSNLMKWTPNW